MPEVNEMTVRKIVENILALEVGRTFSMMVLTLRFSDSMNTLVTEYICKQAVQSIPLGREGHIYTTLKYREILSMLKSHPFIFQSIFALIIALKNQ